VRGSHEQGRVRRTTPAWPLLLTVLSESGATKLVIDAKDGIVSNRSVNKASGVTASKRYLTRLGERTFLSLWTYPGVYKDQGKVGDGHGQEVADLLVVFRNHIIIFSDKDCAYPNTGNPRLDWCRWFRKSVMKSAEQVWGAERWIRSYPDQLFLDRACRERFPLDLPNPATARFHRIVVARTASARCRAALGGSGSLMLEPSQAATVGDELQDRRTHGRDGQRTGVSATHEEGSDKGLSST
jgi:hypothetical protein